MRHWKVTRNRHPVIRWGRSVSPDGRWRLNFLIWWIIWLRTDGER